MSTNDEKHGTLPLQSTLVDFQSWLFRTNIFRWDFEYAKDIHFERYLISSHIKSIQDLESFLDTLDLESKGSFHRLNGCSKTKLVRNYLHKPPNVVDGMEESKLEFSLAMLASSRRICCLCHETGSFAAS